MNNFKLSHPALTAAGALLLALVAFTSGVTAISVLHTSISQTQVAAVAAPEIFPAPLILDGSTLLGKAAVVYDPVDGRILYSKNSETPLPLASLTKLVTATAVLENVSTDTPITITSQDLKPDGDWGFKVGDVVTLSDLLKIGLIASSNDAMQAAAGSLGPNYLQIMEETAQNLGLSDMQFNNPTGLDESTSTAGAYGSAYDIARLAARFSQKYPQYFYLTTHTKVSIPDGDRTLSAAATAIPLDDIPGFIGAKTGYTDLAGGNLAAVFDIEVGHPLVAVVLGSTEEGRFSDIKTLIESAHAHSGN